MENHYLRAVLELGDHQPVVTAIPIVSSKGIKLVDRGVRLSSALYSKLKEHRVIPELDECVSIENPVTRDTIRRALEHLAQSGRFRQFLDTDTLGALIQGALEHFVLSPQIAFKLTLLHAQLPRVFEHSLEVALCALTVAANTRQAGLPAPSAILAGCLFHDLGLLHVDPAVLHKAGPLDEDELHHIYSHPILGELALEHLEPTYPGIGLAILEHHERLDGSGYPKGLEGDHISLFGQLLAIGELVSGILDQYPRVPMIRVLHVALSLNRGKFNARLSQTLLDLAIQSTPGHDEPDFAPAYDEMFSALLAISTVMQHWYDLASHWPDEPLISTIDSRVKTLENRLAGLGIDLAYWRMMDAGVRHDESAIEEMAIGGREARWQMLEIAREVRRRWHNPPLRAEVASEVSHWLSLIEAELGTSPAPTTDATDATDAGLAAPLAPGLPNGDPA